MNQRSIAKQALKFLILLLLCAGRELLFAAEPQPFWKSTVSPGVSLNQAGKLSLLPENVNWGSAECLSRDSFPFWNRDGATVRIKLKFGAATASGYEVFLGFVPEGSDPSVAGSGNAVGVAITSRAADSSVKVGLMRKEAASPDPNIRGSQYGDLVSYRLSAGQQVPQEGDSLEVILKVSSSAVNVKVGSQYSESHPIGLLASYWKNPLLVVRCKNTSEGRGSVRVEEVSVDCLQQLAHFVEPLNLRGVVDMGLRDEVKGDEKGGWTDQGENDLRNLIPGRQSLHSIPFDIIDPSENRGKAALMLYSKNRTYFPRKVGPIPVHQTANSLIFLQSAAWAHSAETAANYAIDFEDGSHVSIPIRVGQEIGDWWGAPPLSNPRAGVLATVRNESSMSGQVCLYGYRWINPYPKRSIRSLRFESANGDAVVGILAVSLVQTDIGEIQMEELGDAFKPEATADLKRFPPDRDQVSDQVSAKVSKRGPYQFSVAGSYDGGGAGKEMLDYPGYAPEISSMGGMSRFPYGLEISFYFWPYSASDWFPVLGAKGGAYGTIERWYYKYGGPQNTLSYQTMLTEYKAKNLKLDIVLNCHSMFDGHDFVYVKTLPEDKMKTQNPLDEGIFNRDNLDKIVRNNETLVDYVVKNGLTDTVATWEMDNERWDMPGSEYAEVVAAHVKMIRSHLPKAKVIVCLGELGPYSPRPEDTHAITWSRDLLKRLQELGMNGQIDYFAPHLYPFLFDNADEITQNYLEDWSIRNIRRSLDYMSGMLDRYGFQESRFFVTEWGTQSDSLGDENHNELISSMGAAIATAKNMMEIYSHPRVEGSTWHQFFGASVVSREKKIPLSKWGEQTVYVLPDHRFVSTPPAEAMKMLTEFGRSVDLVPGLLTVPKGVHYLRGKSRLGIMYFVVNSTAIPVRFPVSGPLSRSSLFAETVRATSILRYGSYGDAPGDSSEILPRDFADNVLPPFSISVLRLKK